MAAVSLGGAAVRTVRGLTSGDLPVDVEVDDPHLEALRPTMDPPVPLFGASASGMGSGESKVAEATGVDDLAGSEGGENSVAVGDVKLPARPVDLFLVWFGLQAVLRCWLKHTRKESREKYTIVSIFDVDV